MPDDRILNRREALSRIGQLGAGAALAGPLASLAGCAGIGSRPPNILFVFSDDHAPHAIGAYGSRINRTPNIDRIAREGAVFTNSFCTNSICAPSRAVVLTGKHSHLNGKIDNRGTFDITQQIFPRLMQDAGYQTAMIGKWHLRADPEGFDYWEVLPGQGRYYNPDFRTPDGTVRHEGYVTDIITDLTRDWLQNHRDPDRPFVAMCQHKAPHRNWMPGPQHLTMYEDVDIPEPETLFDDYSNRASPAANQEMSIANHFYPAYDLKISPADPDNETDRNLWNGSFSRLNEAQQAAWEAVYGPRNERFRQAGLEGEERIRYYYQRYIKDYLRCIASVDDNIGRLLAWLDEADLSRDTIVIYSSDQGFYLGDHGWYDKRWMYEESLRMPFIVRWPGRIQPGARVPQMIQNIDYAPTFLDAAGIPIPEDMQGESLVPLMEGRSPASWRSSIYYHYYEFPAVHMVAKHYGVRTERHKLVYYYETEEWELFDLETDPRELTNRYGDPAYDAITVDLKTELRRLRAYYGDTSGSDFGG
jgi:arylsulfatase A-like enzyme